MQPATTSCECRYARCSGFTLIEMVGVLAVIAILAALLVPKIFAAIDESRYDNTVGSLNGLKAGIMGYFGKESFFPTNDSSFDATLVSKGHMEKKFGCRIGSSSVVRTIYAANSAGGTKFTKLDGVSVIAEGTVVEVELSNVAVADAQELSLRLDGPAMSEEDPLQGDTLGRVVYAAPAAGVVAKLFIYMAHK